MIIRHYGITIDSDEAVTGVVQNNNVEFLDDAIHSGIDLAREEHFEECKGQCKHCHCNHPDIRCSLCVCGHKGQHEYDPVEDEHEFCAPEERGSVLIGSWVKGADGKYEPDKTGDYAAIVREVVSQVVWSRQTKRTALCSPCYPGQGDLDNPGDYLAYDLPWELYGVEDRSEG